MNLNAFVNNLSQLFFSAEEIHFQNKLVFRKCSVYKSQILGKVFVKNQPTYCAVNHAGISVFAGHADTDWRMKPDNAVGVSQKCFVKGGKYFSFSNFTLVTVLLRKGGRPLSNRLKLGIFCQNAGLSGHGVHVVYNLALFKILRVTGIGNFHFFWFYKCQVIAAQNHVLGRHTNGLAVLGV